MDFTGVVLIIFKTVGVAVTVSLFVLFHLAAVKAVISLFDKGPNYAGSKEIELGEIDKDTLIVLESDKNLTLEQIARIRHEWNKYKVGEQQIIVLQGGFKLKTVKIKRDKYNDSFFTGQEPPGVLDPRNRKAALAKPDPKQYGSVRVEISKDVLANLLQLPVDYKVGQILKQHEHRNTFEIEIRSRYLPQKLDEAGDYPLADIIVTGPEVRVEVR